MCALGPAPSRGPGHRVHWWYGVFSMTTLLVTALSGDLLVVAATATALALGRRNGGAFAPSPLVACAVSALLHVVVPQMGFVIRPAQEVAKFALVVALFCAATTLRGRLCFAGRTLLVFMVGSLLMAASPLLVRIGLWALGCDVGRDARDAVAILAAGWIGGSVSRQVVANELLATSLSQAQAVSVDTAATIVWAMWLRSFWRKNNSDEGGGERICSIRCESLTNAGIIRCVVAIGGGGGLLAAAPCSGTLRMAIAWFAGAGMAFRPTRWHAAASESGLALAVCLLMAHSGASVDQAAGHVAFALVALFLSGLLFLAHLRVLLAVASAIGGTRGDAVIASISNIGGVATSSYVITPLGSARNLEASELAALSTVIGPVWALLIANVERLAIDWFGG